MVTMGELPPERGAYIYKLKSECDRPCRHPDQSRGPISDRSTDNTGHQAAF